MNIEITPANPAPNLRPNETIEEKKRKLTLKLNNLESNNYPSSFSMSSNDSTGDFNSINLGNKKFRTNMYNGGFGIIQSETSRNKDLLSNLDMPTPHLEKLINDFNPNNGVLKTPGIELFTPSLDINFCQFGQKGFTPDTSSKNQFHSQSFMESSQEKSECQTPNSTLINPLNIFGANNSYVADNQSQETDNAPNYSNLMPVTQNNFVVQPMSNQVSNSNNNQESSISNQNQHYQNMTTKKDELQTVPIHSNGMLISQRLTNGKKKQSTVKIKNLSDMSNQSGTSSMKSEPDINLVGSITERRNTDKSTTSSTGDMFSPINYENQEDMKLEKKRERNREAARKCRFRKLQKIAELEQKVENLTNLNNEQKVKNKALLDEINEIKQKLQNHQKTHNCDLKMELYNT